MEVRPPRPATTGALDRAAQGIVRAVRTDFGCLLIAVVFLLLMALFVIFSDLFRPPDHNPFV